MAIEENVGDVGRWVTGYVQHLNSVDFGNFKTFNSPTPENMEEAIETAEAEILSWLAEAGYSTDTSTYPVMALRYLSWYNSIGAAYRLELFHPGLQFDTRPNTRFDRLHDLLNELRERILEGGIAGLDIPLDVGGTLKAKFTAQFVTQKQEQEDNTDAVQPFFKRRTFRHPALPDSSPTQITNTNKTLT